MIENRKHILTFASEIYDVGIVLCNNNEAIVYIMSELSKQQARLYLCFRFVIMAHWQRHHFSVPVQPPSFIYKKTPLSLQTQGGFYIIFSFKLSQCVKIFHNKSVRIGDTG